MSRHTTGGAPLVNASAPQSATPTCGTATNAPNTPVNTTCSHFQQNATKRHPPQPAPQAHESASAPNLPRVRRHQDLDRATHTKRASLHVAEALAKSPDIDQARRGELMLNCANHLRDVDGALRSTASCKHRACPWCSQVKQGKTLARLRSALGFIDRFADEAPSALPRSRTTRAIKFTLNAGQACDLNELPNRLKALHKLFPRALKLSAIKDDITGYMRSTEITQSFSSAETTQANPHLHGIILVRGDSDVYDVITAIKDYWPRALRRLYAKQGLYNVLTTTSAEYVEPFEEHTAEAVLSWAKYILKGGSYYFTGKRTSRDAFASTSPDFWQTVDLALHKQRLVSTGGELQIAMAQAETDYQAKRLTEDRLGTAPQPQTKAVKNDDFIYLKSISGYARRALIERASTDKMELRQFLSHPDVTGLPDSGEEEWRVEIMCVARDLSPMSTLTLSMIVANAVRSGINKPPMRVMAKQEQERKTPHWSEPKERHAKLITRGAPQRPPQPTVSDPSTSEKPKA